MSRICSAGCPKGKNKKTLIFFSNMKTYSKKGRGYPRGATLIAINVRDELKKSASKTDLSPLLLTQPSAKTFNKATSVTLWLRREPDLHLCKDLPAPVYRGETCPTPTTSRGLP